MHTCIHKEIYKKIELLFTTRTWGAFNIFLIKIAQRSVQQQPRTCISKILTKIGCVNIPVSNIISEFINLRSTNIIEASTRTLLSFSNICNLSLCSSIDFYIINFQ